MFADVGKNFTIVPDKSTYYQGESIQVLVEANPPPNQYKWTYLNVNTVSTFGS